MEQRWILWFSRDPVFSQEKHTYHRLRETHLSQAGSIQIASEGISLAGRVCIKDCDSCNPLYTAPQSTAQCFTANRCQWASWYPQVLPSPIRLNSLFQETLQTAMTRSWVSLCPQRLYNPSSGVNTSCVVKEEQEGKPHRSRPSLQQAGPSGCGQIMWALGCRDHSRGLSPLNAHSPLGLLLKGKIYIRRVTFKALVWVGRYIEHSVQVWEKGRWRKRGTEKERRHGAERAFFPPYLNSSETLNISYNCWKGPCSTWSKGCEARSPLTSHTLH